MIRDTVDRFAATPLVAACPACGGVVELETPSVGMTIDCPDCEELLLVAGLEPLSLAVATDPDEVAFPDEDEQRELG